MKNILLVLLLLANAQYDWLSTPEAAKAGWQPLKFYYNAR